MSLLLDHDGSLPRRTTRRFVADAATVTMRTHVVRDATYLVTAIENAGPGGVKVSVALSTGKPYTERSQSVGDAKGGVAYVMRNGQHTNGPDSVVCYTSLGSRLLGAEAEAHSEQPHCALLSR